jgi:hypothetical protein
MLEVSDHNNLLAKFFHLNARVRSWGLQPPVLEEVVGQGSLFTYLSIHQPMDCLFDWFNVRPHVNGYIDREGRG